MAAIAQERDYTAVIEHNNSEIDPTAYALTNLLDELGTYQSETTLKEAGGNLWLIRHMLYVAVTLIANTTQRERDRDLCKPTKDKIYTTLASEIKRRRIQNPSVRKIYDVLVPDGIKQRIPLSETKLWNLLVDPQVRERIMTIALVQNHYNKLRQEYSEEELSSLSIQQLRDLIIRSNER